VTGRTRFVRRDVYTRTMRHRPAVALLVIIGAFAAAGAWGVRGLIVGGREKPDDDLRALQAAIADVEAGRKTTPLIGESTAGGDVTVTFLARSPDGPVPRVVSDVTGWGEHIDGTFDFAAGTMTRVGNSDWYSLQTTVAPRARIEYQLAYATTDYRLDPHNPRRSAGPTFGGAAASEFVTPGYVPPQEFEDPRPSPRGTVSEAALEGPCKTMVYSPAGHAAAGGLPVAVFLDLRTDPISRVLDWLIARRDIPPIVAAFVGPKSRGDESCSGAAMAEFVTGRLPAWLRSRHGADGSAEAHAILAISYSAKDALEIALRNPGVFRGLGLMIPGRRINRTDIAGIAGYRDARLRVAILAGRYDHANLPTARALRQALTDAGHTVNYMEVSEGHSASTWRNHLRGVLVGLLGIPSATATAAR
jgi:enterochelin esterase-like enzyme